MSTKECTKKFYKFFVRSGQNEENLKSISRYVNGMHYSIQDEFSVLNFRSRGRKKLKAS